MVVASYGRNKNLDGEIQNIAGIIPGMTWSRKIAMITDLMRIPHNYSKHFETTGKL